MSLQLFVLVICSFNPLTFTNQVDAYKRHSSYTFKQFWERCRDKSTWKEFTLVTNVPSAMKVPQKYTNTLNTREVGLYDLRRWLQDIDAYSLQRPLWYKFKIRRVIAQGIDALWDVDLADVSNLAKHNAGTRYLLVAIDVFSRYLWVEALKNKFHQSIIHGLQKSELRTDKGSEWKNKWVTKRYLQFMPGTYDKGFQCTNL